MKIIEDGVPVLGYLHWALIDNFEWVFGYGHQLGLGGFKGSDQSLVDTLMCPGSVESGCWNLSCHVDDLVHRLVLGRGQHS